ncbi:MAG: TonB family protein [Firmicutes bacterium]|nr:TonB family protein [Bacillota bacterium]
MTVSERRNYQVAVLFALIFHLSLALVVFPMQLLTISSGVEEMAVGIYELSDFELEDQATEAKPELIVKAEKQKPKPIPSPAKPVVHANPKPKNGQPDQIVKPGTEHLNSPIGLGDGSGMVIGFGRPPYYPKNAENEGSEGQVLVRVFVKKDGSLEKTEIKEKSGDLRLDNAAVNSLKREWIFKPNTEDYYIDILFSFSMDSRPGYKLIDSATRP